MNRPRIPRAVFQAVCRRLAGPLAVLLTLTAVPGEARSADDVDIESVVVLLEFVIESDEETARKCLGILTSKVQTRELRGRELGVLRADLRPILAEPQAKPDHPLHQDVLVLASSWGDLEAVERTAKLLIDPRQPVVVRRRALDALAAGSPAHLQDAAGRLLPDADLPTDLRGRLLAVLGRSDDPEISTLILTHYPRMSPELQPKAIEVLTQRMVWSRELLKAIGDERVPATALNTNQVAKLLAVGDQELAALVRKTWGVVRTERSPQREQVIVQMRALLTSKPGDPFRGRKVFDKVCGQCHQIHGKGHAVGPDLTRNGRGNFEQLINSVFDPSLVIGAAYQARTVITVDGRVLTGLVAEDSSRRIVLKIQGGKTEIVAREDIDEVVESKLSLMPEGLEKQIQPVELADLFAFLCLDLPPENSEASLIPGAPTFTE